MQINVKRPIFNYDLCSHLHVKTSSKNICWKAEQAAPFQIRLTYSTVGISESTEIGLVPNFPRY